MVPQQTSVVGHLGHSASDRSGTNEWVGWDDVRYISRNSWGIDCLEVAAARGRVGQTLRLSGFLNSGADQPHAAYDGPI